MSVSVILLILVAASAAAFVFARRFVVSEARQHNAELAALPGYYGICAFFWTMVPALLMLIAYTLIFGKIGESTTFLRAMVTLGVAGASFGTLFTLLSPGFHARHHAEGWGRVILWAATLLSVSITVFIFLSVVIEATRFFKHISVIDFLFGLQWSPQMAMRADQAGSSGAFGAVPVFLGTLMITFIAMLVATPVGLMSAIYISEYATPTFRNRIKPFLEILAGIPTVVYGFFAVVAFAPALRNLGASMGINIASESALAAGVTMGIMIIPFILSLSDDVMNAVPRSLKDASLGLGATRSETVKKVIIPAALPGIAGAVLLAISRGIGETMIVVMAAGLSANLTLNPLNSVTTVTVQIVTLLVGDQEFDSPKTLAAFALGLTLFLVTLALNVVALLIVRKYREKYD
ncbi:MAG: phosphate ABC transporter permease subunit PstC [Proteobacteria bacterium]|nr:phosphate ABC transporter permease subunit PstC [Pseudomonadota bacterium]